LNQTEGNAAAGASFLLIAPSSLVLLFRRGTSCCLQATGGLQQ